MDRLADGGFLISRDARAGRERNTASGGNEGDDTASEICLAELRFSNRDYVTTRGTDTQQDLRLRVQIVATVKPDRRSCSPDELPAGYTHGERYSAPLVDMPAHLTYLTRRLSTAGGAIQISRVDSLDEVAERASIVINCTGVGARALVADEQIYPIRGQHVVVSNPGLTDFLEVDTGDSADLIAIYPHQGHVILGGTAEPHCWNREPDQENSQRIIARCTSLEPRLRQARVLEVRVGLRPTRFQVRLEAEERPGGTVLIHNYGHGGAGVSLSWGCAAAVAELCA